MKLPSTAPSAVLCCAVAFAASASIAAAADTAYSALRLASAQLGKDSQNRVVEISGRAGRPQPPVWKVTVEDSGARGGIQEVEIQKGRVVGQRRPASGASGGRLNLSVIQLDSDGVFSIVNGEAIRSGVSFDRLDYVLSLDPQSGAPVWSVDLFDGPNVRAGSVRIAAESGQVLFRSRELELTEAQKREARWSKEGEDFRSVPDFFHRMGKRTEKTGYKLKNWVNGYGWTAERNPAVPEYPAR